MKKIILIFLACIPIIIQAQSQSYVQLRGKQFFYNGANFIPMVVNYGLVEVSDYPLHSNVPIYPCGDEGNPSNYQTQIPADMKRIKAAGFNTIRILNLNPTIDAATQKLIFGWPQLHIDPPYTEHFARIDLTLDLIKASNQDIKIIYFVGGGFTSEFNNYLDMLVTHLRGRTEIIAYDLANEPDLDQSKTKQDVCKTIDDQYNIIKRITKNQLVTIGLEYSYSYAWDVSMLSVDFISFHWYPLVDNQYNDVAAKFKNYGSVCKKPWIIGETGLTGNDNYVGITTKPGGFSSTIQTSEQQQKYAEFSVKRTFDCGASGYSWFGFRDRTHVGEPCCFGLVTDMQDGDSNKPAYDFFKGFNAQTYTVNPNNCFGISNDIYTNFLGITGGYTVTGHIYDENGNPVSDAYVEERDNKGGVYYTFSLTDGSYKISTGDASRLIIKLMANKTGYKNDTIVDYSGIISPANLNLTYELSPISVSVTGCIGNNQSLSKSSSGVITVNNLVVTDNGSVTLKASSLIKFNTGFSAQKGTSVYAYTGAFQDCDNLSSLKSFFVPNENLFPTKIDTIKTSSGHFIFPNPNDGNFNCVIKDNSPTNIRLEIFNMNGQKVYSSVLYNGFNLINISDKPKGIYILKAFIKDKVYIDKLVKN